MLNLVVVMCWSILDGLVIIIIFAKVINCSFNNASIEHHPFHTVYLSKLVISKLIAESSHVFIMEQRQSNHDISLPNVLSGMRM